MTSVKASASPPLGVMLTELTKLMLPMKTIEDGSEKDAEESESENIPSKDGPYTTR